MTPLTRGHMNPVGLHTHSGLRGFVARTTPTWASVTQSGYSCTGSLPLTHGLGSFTTTAPRAAPSPQVGEFYGLLVFTPPPVGGVQLTGAPRPPLPQGGQVQTMISQSVMVCLQSFGVTGAEALHHTAQQPQVPAPGLDNHHDQDKNMPQVQGSAPPSEPIIPYREFLEQVTPMLGLGDLFVQEFPQGDFLDTMSGVSSGKPTWGLNPSEPRIIQLRDSFKSPMLAKSLTNAQSPFSVTGGIWRSV